MASPWRPRNSPEFPPRFGSTSGSRASMASGRDKTGMSTQTYIILGGGNLSPPEM